jgi:hypothetical protein
MPEDIRIFCNSCRRTTRHNIQQVFEHVNDEGQIVRWQTIQCGGCDEVSFYGVLVLEGGAVGQDESPTIYPPRIDRAARQFDGLNARLDRIYQEMIVAFNNGSYILCAGGLRTLVEGICAEQNINDGPKWNHATGEYERNRNTGEVSRSNSLDCKIEGLAERNILTERQARSLHEHRYLGNMALHELGIPDKETLESAITIVEHIMEDLYNIPAHVGNLVRVRGNVHREGEQNE